MKRCLLFIVLIVTLVGCEQDNLPNEMNEGMEIYVENIGDGNAEYIAEDELNNLKKDDLISADIDWLSDSKLVVTYTNNTELHLLFGKGHVLQRLNGDEWENIDVQVSQIDVAYTLEPGASFEETIDLILYGFLNRGQYRALKIMNEDKMDESTGFLAEDRQRLEVVFVFEISN
jgi:hypothetical protein